jgi:pimeloyl-ACP methyl ester carboxylesterase
VTTPKQPKAIGRIHRWVRRGFLLWAVTSTGWMVNSMRTQGVDAALLESDEAVTVTNSAVSLDFVPASPVEGSGLVFLCGAGVAAQAYAPLLRPIAEAGYPVFIVKLPFRFAPLESHKQAALARARRLLDAHPRIDHWVIAGHSQGGALAARLAQTDYAHMAALVLIGTTHPKEDDLSFLRLPVTKVYATEDGIAPSDRVLANRALLPAQTRWVAIEGGNHSQFGHYGHQFRDGKASISREAQQAQTREALLDRLIEIGP